MVYINELVVMIIFLIWRILIIKNHTFIENYFPCIWNTIMIFLNEWREQGLITNMTMKIELNVKRQQMVFTYSTSCIQIWINIPWIVIKCSLWISIFLRTFVLYRDGIPVKCIIHNRNCICTRSTHNCSQEYVNFVIIVLDFYGFLICWK